MRTIKTRKYKCSHLATDYNIQCIFWGNVAFFVFFLSFILINQKKKKKLSSRHTHTFYVITSSILFCDNILSIHSDWSSCCFCYTIFKQNTHTKKKQSFGCFAHHQLATIDVDDDDENQDSWYLFDINLLLLFKLYTVPLCVYVSHDLIKLSTEWTNTQREKKKSMQNLWWAHPFIHSFQLIKP